MFSYSILWLAFSSTAFAQSQEVLSNENERPSFISSSIFGRSDIDLNEFQNPTILPPTYEARSFGGDSPFSGLGSFAHPAFTDCTKSDNNGTFDIGIAGDPFDLGVSYRPGAKFGPNGARVDHGIDPFRNWATVTDCEYVENTPFDKSIAIHELEKGMRAINLMEPKKDSVADAVRLITIGGDHTITLPILRTLDSTWVPVAVLHFDSHLDIWDPKQLGGVLTKYSEINLRTMLHIAHEEGLLSNHSNVHLGSRTNTMIWITVSDVVSGVDKIVEKIVQRIGDEYIYLSVDIDVLDLGFAPATGTIEPGGWTTRELLQIIYDLTRAGIKIIGSDIVDFTPIYDNAAETTGIAISEIIFEILQWMIHVPVQNPKI